MLGLLLNNLAVAEATAADVDSAVAAAKAAQPAWAALSPQERGKPLAKLAQMITEATPELAKLDALSLGRPVSKPSISCIATLISSPDQHLLRWPLCSDTLPVLLRGRIWAWHILVEYAGLYECVSSTAIWRSCSDHPLECASRLLEQEAGARTRSR